ncbi:MAG: hypothetical protein ACLTBV_21790 [Enterocloster bolteae]
MLPAPSTEAASDSSDGILDKAAVKSSITYPRFFHTVTRATLLKAVSELCSQANPRQAQHMQQLVGQSCIRFKYPGPHNGYSHSRRNPGREEYKGVYGVPSGRPHQQGQYKTQNQDWNHRLRSKQKGVGKGFPKSLIL